MPAALLKLKQASAVLETSRKELQNLVQFGVLKPRRRAGLYVFDAKLLYIAKVALFLKKALGTNTEMLSEFTGALVDRLRSLPEEQRDVIVFKSRCSAEGLAVEVTVPFGQLVQEVEDRLRLVELYRDLPRGRKRRGWKKEFKATMEAAANDMGEVSTEEILRTIREYRSDKRRKPEVTVEAETAAARA